MASKISCRVGVAEQRGFLRSSSYSLHHTGSAPKAIEFRKFCHGQLLCAKICSSSKGFWHISRYSHTLSEEGTVVCFSAGTEAKECRKSFHDCSNASSDQLEDGQDGGYAPYSSQGLAEACRFVHNDAKYVNERARNDIILLSRGMTRLNDCARQHIAVLGLGFLKLDARARGDTETIDLGVKEKATHLHHVSTTLKDKAQSDLKRASDKHWSDGALEFIRGIHDVMANKMYQKPPKEGSWSDGDKMGFITPAKNGKALDMSAVEVTTDRMHAIEDTYWTVASALSEADGIDYTDPEQLELLVAALIDLDAMDAERKALANALATAPSMWILGNAGMGALQRLAQDGNAAIAAAAAKAINELKQQWEVEESHSFRFKMNQSSQEEDRDDPNSQANS